MNTRWLVRLMLLSVLFTGTALAESDADRQGDPLEWLNRKVFTFNDTLDRYLLLPVTKGYKSITPDPVERSVSNFFANLGDVRTLVNDLLQFKFHRAAQDTSRIMFNTVFGVAGLFDVATTFGLPRNDEDFGQTLGYWGVGSGPYLVLPLLGPSTLRDGAGRIVDSVDDPINYVESERGYYALTALDVIETRARLMAVEKLISGDKYSFIRDAYLQRRIFEIKDGEVADVYKDDGF